MTRPTQPIMPLTATLAAVRNVAHRMTTRRSAPVFTPSVAASSSPSVRMLMRQRSSSSGAAPIAIGISAKPTSASRVPERLPMSQ